MKSVPPKMPKQNNEHYIVVLCLAFISIVLCSITGRFSFFWIVAIGLSVGSMVLAWKEFDLKKEWIIATALATVSIGICVFTLFNGLHMRVQYGAHHIVDDIYDKYYEDTDEIYEFFDEDNVDYFD